MKSDIRVKPLILKFGVDKPIEIILSKDGQFSYFEQGQNILTGTWLLTGYPFILLEKEKPYLNFYYEIEKVKRNDQLGIIDIIALKPISNDKIIKKCKMYFGVSN